MPRPGPRAGALIIAALVAHAPALAHAGEARRVALFTGTPLPLDALAFFADAILDPERAPPAEVAELARRGTAPVALVAVDRDGAIGARARALLAAGWAGVCVAGVERAAPDRVLAELRALRASAPAARLYLRGPLSLAGAAGGLLSGVLLDGPAPARELAAFRARAPDAAVVVVERAPDRAAARARAARLADAGVTPWVLVGGADRLGVGAVEPVPRRILALYDGAEEDYLPFVLVHRMAAVPLEHLGYAVDYADARGELPAGDLAARYAGVVTWFTDDELAHADRYQAWLARQLDAGVRVAVLGQLGFPASRDMLARLGLDASPGRLEAPVAVASKDAVVGFEAPVVALARDVPAWSVHRGTVHLALRDPRGRAAAVVFTTPWGGVALDPYVLEFGWRGRMRWVLDPFAFLAEALDLPPIPAPDPTTESGARVMEVHIDGDGFASAAEIPGHPLAGDVVMRDFLVKYPVPTTVSIIEGETSPEGLYRALSPRLEAIARRIFALPSVEVASHSYSHPFDWLRAQGDNHIYDRGDPEDRTGDAPNLTIPGYKYSVEREVAGSIAYINRRLAPPDKPARAFLWSGSALPPEEAVKVAADLSLANMNGSSAEEPLDEPTLAQVPSLGRPMGPHLQAYAPAQNENVYTGLWRGPYYGFRRLIDTLRFTDSPRRLKPISIYYHFYSGTKPAAITALDEVYRWALAQETRPAWVSEVYRGVRDFHRATLARRLDGAWELRGLVSLRTVRLDRRLGWPDLERSPDVVGVRELPQGRYVALAGGAQQTLALTDQAPALPHLVSSNAGVVSWRRRGRAVSLRLGGHVPVRALVAGCREPALTGPGARVTTDRAGAHLTFTAADTGERTLTCR